MKYELETMPVWDALDRESECFLCDLMKEAEDHAISYFLGSSVMHPETRVSVNHTGFCAHHWAALSAAGKPQPLGLVAHTYLEQTINLLDRRAKPLMDTANSRSTAKEVQRFRDALRTRESGCLVCSMMNTRLERYLFTAVKLWADDPDFHQRLLSGKGVCLHHLDGLFIMARRACDTKDFPRFAKEMTHLVLENLRRLEREIWWMTQKYKAEHVNDPWNGCEDAHKRVVGKIIGEGRIWESP